MMITELFGHVTFETHFLEFRLLAGAVLTSPGMTAVPREIKNNAYAKFWVAYFPFTYLVYLWDCSWEVSQTMVMQNFDMK